MTYYRNRINLEVFHVLTDGTGAMNFLKTLVSNYLTLAENVEDSGVDYDASSTQKSDDSFSKYYSGKISSKQENNPVAYKIVGRKYPDDKLKVINGMVDVKKVLEESHKYNATLTAFLSAVLIKSIIDEMACTFKRQETNYNTYTGKSSQLLPIRFGKKLFCLTYIQYDIKKHGEDFETMVDVINTQLKSKLKAEKLLGTIDTYSAVEHNVITRIVPLVVKDFFLRIAYRMSAEPSRQLFQM